MLCSLVLGTAMSLTGCYSTIQLEGKVVDSNNKVISFKVDIDNEHGATTKYDKNGNPVVIYNPIWLSRLPKQGRQFFIYHEIGYLHLGHLEKYHFPTISKSDMEKAQLEADCYSVRELRKQGYSAEDMTVVYDTLFLEDGAKRAGNILRCLKK